MQNGLKRQLHRGESLSKKENAHVKWDEDTAAQSDSCLQKGECMCETG